MFQYILVSSVTSNSDEIVHADELQDVSDDSESYANTETSTVHGKQLLKLKAKNIS